MSGRRCQPCKSAYAKARHLANPEEQRTRSRAWYVANQERAKARARTWGAANREKTNAKVRAWVAANPERRKEHQRTHNRKWYAANAEKERARSRVSLLRRYGLTAASFDALLATQGGGCRICQTIKPGARGWHVDHDHACCPGNRTCGQCVRGLLCHSCNLMLGQAGDDPEVLRRAIAYLEAPKGLRLVK
jgi:recombination endonuclease VII